MSRKKTKEEHLLKFIEKHGDEYDYSKFLDDSFILKINYQKIPIICPIHGLWDTTTIQSHTNGTGCPKCAFIKNANKRMNSKEYRLNKFRKVHGEFYDYSKFLCDDFILKNNKQKIPIICPIHGIFDTTNINNHMGGKGCKKCASIKISKDRLKSKDERIVLFRKNNSDKYDYSLFLSDDFLLKTGKQKIPIICHKHGMWDTTTIQEHSKGSDCPKCNNSKGELKVEQILKENNINFINQKKFKECKHQLPLPFDFYLPELNICIEFDGIQHFNVVEYWGGEKGLKLQKKKDRIKTKFCKDNNIKLLRIRYDENIEDKMNELLRGH